MTTCIDHMLITASAGSGKTYTLANRMIRWLICHRRHDGISAPDRLLGATFTRKAAGEILHRILKHLVLGVSDSRYRQGELAEALVIDPPPSQEELAAVLDEVIDALGELQLGTLDSLFMQMATLFAPALGLTPGWTISEAADDREIKRVALGRVISGMEISEAVETLLELTQGDPASRALDTLSASIFGNEMRGGAWPIYTRTRLLDHSDSGESACPPSVAAWSWMDDLSDAELVPDGRVLDDAAMAAMLQGARMIEDPPQKTVQGAWRTLLSLLRERRWWDVLKQKICLNVYAGNLRHGRSSLSDEIVAVVQQATSHARVMAIRDLRSGNRSVVEMLQRIQQAIDVERDRRGRYGFSDVTSRLAGAGLIGADSLEDLWFRMSVDIRDVALDEFQDTSVEQYMILQPIIEQIMAGTGDEAQRGFLIVADAKQSIYGWRGGTPALVESFRRRYETSLDPSESLVKSYRSSPVIMNFVNLVFGDLVANPAITNSVEPVQQAAAKWSEHFADHESARSNLEGVVTVTIADGDDVVPTAVNLTDLLHRQRTTASIGVLCRTNTLVADVVTGLRRRGLDVSQEGGGEIDDDLAVSAVLSLLHLADHPADTISLFHVTNSPLGETLDVPPWIDIDPEHQGKVAAEVATMIRRRVQREGYGPLIEDLASRLRPHVDQRSVHRLRQLIDLGSSWDERSTMRTRDFISFVQSERVSAVTAHNVRVMSVHAAKGLEFDEVVLVGLDEATGLTGRSPAFCYAVTDVNGITLPTRVCKRMSKELWSYFPVLESMGFPTAWQVASTSDALSVLYVAITRARCGVHAVIKDLPTSHRDTPDSHPIPTTSAGLLRGAIDRDLLERPLRSGELHAGETIVVMGDMEWEDSDRIDREEIVESVAVEPLPLLAPLRGTRYSRSARPPSDHGVDLERAFSQITDGVDGRLVGTIVHEALARITWWNEDVDLEGALAAASNRAAIDAGAPPSDRIVEIAGGILDRCGEQAAITSRLAPGAYPESDLEVLNEFPWISQGEGGLGRGRIDRLVLGRTDGRVVWADVVDYKTDRIDSPLDRERVVEFYAGQITAYRHVVADMFDLERTAVTGRLLLLSTGEDVEIGDGSGEDEVDEPTQQEIGFR